MLLQLQHITKRYGGLTANDNVDFELAEGEVHAIIGENGAGKSTLMKIVYGEERPTSGRIVLNGRDVSFQTPADAIAAGIGMVHQHFMLFPSFTVAENIVFGREPRRGVRFDRKKAAEHVRALSEKYGMPVEPDRPISECPVGIRQRVEILKVLNQGARIVILDEPTGALTPLEVEWLLKAIRQLAKQGISFILISHKLQEVMGAADRVTVLRDGRVTGVLHAGETSADNLSRLMVGRELARREKRETAPGRDMLRLKDVSIAGAKGARPLLDRVSLQVRAGEIVGVAGVSGNGQSELIQAIAGLARVDGGTIELVGRDMTNAPPLAVRQAGLAHIPEDRYMWGAAAEESIADNGVMGHTDRHSVRGMMSEGRIRQTIAGFVSAFNIKAGSPDAKAKHLSGGNMQKLIVARELAHGTPFVIAAEPTRGVDIGAMETIHDALLKRREEGGAVLLVSSELTEILQLSDRIVVMYEGRIAGELPREEATEERISLLMSGGAQVEAT